MARVVLLLLLRLRVGLLVILKVLLVSFSTASVVVWSACLSTTLFIVFHFCGLIITD